jgi:hypothetical protein
MQSYLASTLSIPYVTSLYKYLIALILYSLFKDYL